MKNWRTIALSWLMLFLFTAAPAFSQLSTYTGFTQRATGYTVLAADWNNEFSNFINHYNANAIGTFNLMASAGKGAILTFTGGVFAALGNAGAGDNGKVLTLDSTLTNGIKWASLANLTTLTTNGDTLYYNGSNQRLPIGTNGQVYTIVAGLPAWVSATTVPTGIIAIWSGTIASIPSGWALCDGVHNTSGINLQGLFVVGAGNQSPAATGGMGLVTPGGPSGTNSAGAGLGPAHSHTVTATQNIGYAAGASTTFTYAGVSVQSGNATVTPKYYALSYIEKL